MYIIVVLNGSTVYETFDETVGRVMWRCGFRNRLALLSNLFRNRVEGVCGCGNTVPSLSKRLVLLFVSQLLRKPFEYIFIYMLTHIYKYIYIYIY